MRYLVFCAYDGTNYYGWQKQSSLEARSITAELEKAFKQIFSLDVKIHGAGRTDKKVHAKRQAFHFDMDEPISDLNKTLYSLNCLLPNDIFLESIEVVDAEFHVRFHATHKTYLYRINNGVYNPFLVNYALQLNQKLDLGAMEKASQIFLGEHNFTNFTTKEEDDWGFIRTIESIKFETTNDGMIEIYIRGNGFMRYMVRFIVGSLIQVGLKRITLEELQILLENHTMRQVNPYKAEPQGLYLFDIAYQ